MARTLPRWMHRKHGRYYLVRANKWHPLSRDLRQALIEYADLVTARPSTSIDALVQRTLNDMKESVAPSTFKNYCTCARRVTEAFAEFSPKQVRPTHVAAFLDDAKATPSMADLLRSFMKGMFQRAVRWGVVDVNPVRDIKPFKTKPRDRYINEDEFARIRREAPETLQCLMDIAYLTGQRIGDVMSIRYCDISDEGVFFQQQKTAAKVLVAM